MCLLIDLGQSRYSESASYKTNCPSQFKQYGDRSCFRLFSGSYSFQGGSDYCHSQHNGKLLTISNTSEYNHTSVYVKLHGKSEQPYWVGLLYHNNSVLADVDGNIVNASMLGGVESAMGDCVYMKYSNERLIFVQDNCSNSHNIVCLMEWPGM